jgi:pimeloyl-ACP methyl ester carboxylesterase
VANECAEKSPSALDMAGTEACFAEVEGARMRYLRAGSGPPLILVHGLLAYSFSWRFTIPALSPHATVYAVDMLGTGYSDRPRNLDCRLRANAERLLHFADAIGVSRFDLLGTSYGGAVAMMAAAVCAERGERPGKRIGRLILAAPVNPWSVHGRHFAPFVGSRMGSLVFRMAIAPARFTYHYWLERLYGDPGRIPPGTLKGYSAPYKIAGTFEHVLGIVRNWTADLEELKSVLPGIADYPALLVWGSRDRAVEPGSAEPLRRVFKNCELVILEGAGHMPYEEVPDEFNPAVTQFLVRPHEG